MSKISVLGAGNIGKFIAEWLTSNTNHEVTSYDYNYDVVTSVKATHSKVADLSKQNDVVGAIKDADIIINALPSFLGFLAFKTAINLGKNIVDFSYMTEDPRQLDALAKKNGVTAVMDFGFAPGMCHMFVGRALKLLGHVNKSIIYVGGLPQDESDEYKVVFSARDVLEEYSRPARIIKDGKVVTVTPFDTNYTYNTELPNGKLIDLSGFVSDGLRTMTTLDGVDNLLDSTLRYHKHFEKMEFLKEDGFFKPDNIEATAKVLANKWKRGPEDRDMSILNVISELGAIEVQHMLYDEYNEDTGIHSMARVTGFPVITMTLMILNKEFNTPGVHVPEVLGQDEIVFKTVCERLRDRGIILTETVKLKEVTEAQ